MFSDELILPWLDRLREEVPGVEAFDVHTHIGQNDPDGFKCTPEQLIEKLEMADIRGIVFPMHEPDGYPPHNDRVLEVSRNSGGRLQAFGRLDPEADPLAEATRCLDAGAVGLKFHPRAENTGLNHPALRDVFALLEERRRPLIVHAGRGIPALGKHAVELAEAYPNARLILAHAGICDLAWIWKPAQELPNLYFDTAWWLPSDLLTLFTLVPPGQVLFGSDAPYGTPAAALTMSIRYALQSGLDAEQIRGVTGGQLERLVAAEDPLDLGPAPGTESLTSDPLLERVYGFLLNALGQMFAGREPEEGLDLVRLACEVGDDAPQATICSSILSLLEQRRQVVESGVPDGRPAGFAPHMQFVVAAAALSRTPDVPLPADPVAVDVGERTPSA